MAEKKGKTTLSLILSLTSIAAWVIPLLGILWFRSVQHSMDELH